MEIDNNDLNKNTIAGIVGAMFPASSNNLRFTELEGHECCSDGNRVCLLYDPCLTRLYSSNIYLSFLRGEDVKVHPYVPFSSAKSLDNKAYFSLIKDISMLYFRKFHHLIITFF